MGSNFYAKQGSYVVGAAVTRAAGWLILALDDLVAKNIANAGFFYLQDKTMTPLVQRRYRARYAAVLPGSTDDIIAIGEYGQYTVLSRSGQARDDVIDAQGITPPNRGPLRSGSVINGHLIMVGMFRQVYDRDPAGTWRVMEVGLPAPVPDTTPGFEAVAGSDLENVYAVGWDGEIWRFDGSRWHAIDSPTNRILTSVCITENRTVYACGRGGLLVRGTDPSWDVLDSGCPDDLWSITSFRGEVFAASLRRIYRLMGDKLVQVDADSSDSFATFSQCGQALWSVGAKAVVAYDGTGWSQQA